MKRLKLLFLCLLPLAAFCQQWDAINDMRQNRPISVVVQTTYPTGGRRVTSSNIYKVPDFILQDYLHGKRIYDAGVAFITIGSLASAIGAFMYFYKGSNDQCREIGLVTMSAGGALVGISIPLLTAGDIIKRGASRDFQLYKKSLK